MTIRDMQIEFERRLQTFDPTEKLVGKLPSDTILSFINEATDKFVKTRYTGLTLTRTGFEQTQKRIDDLRALVVTAAATPTYIAPADLPSDADKAGKYKVVLPDEYLFLLGDTAFIAPNPANSNECWEKDSKGNDKPKATDTLESTVETIDRQIADPLSEFHMKYCQARPLRLIEGNEIHLYCDTDYQVVRYTYTYLKTPRKWVTSDLLGKYSKTEKYQNNTSEFPDNVCLEIVKIAVELYMATKPVQHYNVYANEVATME